MKIFIASVLLIGALFIPAGKGLREAGFNAASTLASGIERLVIRGNYAEIRKIDEYEFDDVIREPGRVVIVVIQKELTASSRGQVQGLDRAMKELPGKVLIAKVTAERNMKLVKRLEIKNLPAIHVYQNGNLLRKFEATVDKDDFIEYIHERIEAEPVKATAPVIRPMNDQWLPPGVEKKD